MTTWFVYVLRCSDNSLYCGTTTDLDRRLQAHNTGTGARYTRSRSPVRLVWYRQAPSKSEAFREEFRIKRLHKAEKELLVTCDKDGELEYSNPIGGIAMTKAELVAKLAEEANVTKKAAAAMLGQLGQDLANRSKRRRLNPHRRVGNFCGYRQESSGGREPSNQSQN